MRDNDIHAKSKLIIQIIAGLGMLGCLALLFPMVRYAIITFAETYIVHRSLTVQVWYGKFIKWSFLGMISISLFYLIICSKYPFGIHKQKETVFLAVFLIAVFSFLPFVLFGKNSIITIHDNLDSNIPWYKMFHDNGLFLKFDVPTKGFSGMSTLYYDQVGFYFQSLLYLVFSDFAAYTLSYYFSVLFACISMYILLKKAAGISQVLSIFMALCYALLPIIPVWNIAASTLPLIIAIFFYFASRNSKVFLWKSLLLLFFPFFSFFASIGIFILGFWFIGLLVLIIKNRKINLNLLVGFILLCTGYILADLRLFYMMFVLKTPLNRTVFDIQPASIFQTLKVYGINGYYHASSFQRNIIVPTAFFVSLYFFILLFRRIQATPGKLYARIKTVLVETDNKIKLLFLFECLIVLFCFIAALYDSRLLEKCIKRWIPVLAGFNWGRVWIFNRVLWYIVFAFCLQFILQIHIENIRFFKKVKLSPLLFLPKLIAAALVCLQLGYILLSPVEYNDQVKTWFKSDSFISYKDFFAKDLFESIKEDISYSNEMVAAFGYHPSVLMYNGFNCIDGYNNAYPLSYMQKFRTLIAPELEINQWAKGYYDGWGGRMYFFNSGEDFYQPTRNKNPPPVKLAIDMEVFKNDFNGKYILSRTEITNSEVLGLALVKKYYHEKSIYTIYLYKAD